MPRKTAAQKKRSAAAKKGWRTRERNKRSAAAKKGWQTRKRNERAQARAKTKPKTKGDRREYVIHFDYGSKKGRNLIRFQVHIQGPETTDREAVEVIRRWERDGALPKEWKQLTIDWSRPPKGRTRPLDGTRGFTRIKKLAIMGGSPKVRKSTI